MTASCSGVDPSEFWAPVSTGNAPKGEIDSLNNYVIEHWKEKLSLFMLIMDLAILLFWLGRHFFTFFLKKHYLLVYLGLPVVHKNVYFEHIMPIQMK